MLPGPPGKVHRVCVGDRKCGTGARDGRQSDGGRAHRLWPL